MLQTRVYVFNITGAAPTFSVTLGFLEVSKVSELAANDEIFTSNGKQYVISNPGTVSDSTRTGVILTDVDGHAATPNVGYAPVWTPTPNIKLSQTQFTDVLSSVRHLIRNRDSKALLDSALHVAASVSGNGISITGQDISLTIGTGSTDIAAGDHDHTELHWHENFDTLDDIGDDGYFPTWRGGPWPGGDMYKSVYDPTNKAADAFSMNSMDEGATTKILTPTERTNITSNTAARHDAASVSGDGISIAGQDISLNIGTNSTDVAAGNHDHVELHWHENFDSLDDIGDDGYLPTWRGGAWPGGGSGGDMYKSVYDPNNKAADAFSMDNQVEGATTKILSATERQGIADNTSARHDAASVSGNGISITGQALSLNIGTAATDIAAGDHGHTDLHTQGTDLGLDTGGANAVTAASITGHFTTHPAPTNRDDRNEAALGDPLTDDYVLSSKADGTREWVAKMDNPMTEENQVIRGGTAGAPTAVDIGNIPSNTIAINSDLLPGHIRKGLLKGDSATTIILAVKLQTAQTYIDDSALLIVNKGAGDLEIEADTGVTINGENGGWFTLQQYEGVSLVRDSENTWIACNVTVGVAR